MKVFKKIIMIFTLFNLVSCSELDDFFFKGMVQDAVGLQGEIGEQGDLRLILTTL